eukprot:CAMPEP_0172787442 /NCGR_PEP_ID=MMETSP1074-20121228/206455_1 /TAXON_ID=2916 /ORGANISM="Ceratium fusus, Strain PA161109" /LENGTH=122 /DNA_ID=CAMNT_0013624467 /DNA_START=289 /DNA_END=657 /DNA_ORIENTATION=+
MALPAQMHDATALLMLVCEAMVSMLWIAYVAAELQPRSTKVEAQADVESDIGVVSVHVKAKVFSFTIAHNETVVAIPRATRKTKKKASNGLQQMLELVDKGFKTNVTKNDTIIVHAVRAPRG